VKNKKELPLTAVWRNGGCSASYDSFVVGSSAVLRLNFCTKNPPLRQAAKRYSAYKKIKTAMLIDRKLIKFATWKLKIYTMRIVWLRWVKCPTTLLTL
jgi:hypothetical protein